MMKTLIPILFLLVLLAGCATQPKRQINLSFPPVEYVK